MDSPEALKNHLAAIVEGSDDAIITKNLGSIILSWNQGAERLFGYTAQEVIGQPITMLMPQDRKHEEVGIISRLRRGQQPGNSSSRRSKVGARSNQPADSP